jgi:hypothetical protein
LPEHPGTNKLLVLQRGTLFCSNLVVPHTGKAVEGVWPSVVQACPKAEFAHTERKMIKNKIPDFADIIERWINNKKLSHYFDNQIPCYVASAKISGNLVLLAW